MSRYRLRGAIFAAWALVVAVALVAVRGHEQTLAEGELALLQLAPVDPRSLMQGDYMALRFAADEELGLLSEAEAKDVETMPSFAHFTLDEQRRADFAGVGDTPARGRDTISMRIRRIDGGYSIGPNAFFFQEGTGEQFEAAQWGGFKVADDGTALLVSLHDAELQMIGSQQR